MIRAYSSNDKGKLVELLRLNTPEFFHPDEEKDFIEYLEQEAENYFVVEDAGMLVGAGGFNGGFDNGRTVRISWDIIHPDYQGKGIGKKLTRYRIDQIREDPAVKKIVVRTTQLVYGFYQKIGFELEKVEKDYWAEGFDLYQMKLDLNKASSS
ncbi:N-acetylglutamate synthase-like GNAT family acetyltransferase [Pontibacter ummariensis]|uniref:N-acetylglutamate synthase, GNAT family n=1 Tax=Pontibacter ummariensis TaxID=1610492 RepID=A0A239EG24_9BACT|nr:N-acetyltransferase [Pontibacter ummariensis]PRY13237.1 N-acetylglutamate synthase-like GNAT family acetyltransferase [Pontibacter ummariensis]SNS43499.1 N-acetylglutamate synthase, GNAT family [Pontibacter ummariensis]